VPERIEFGRAVVSTVARKAMYVCSNPDCLRLTGFTTSRGRPRAIAQAAHIRSASPGGPRQDDPVELPDGSTVARGDEANAVWLCSACHIRVDADPEGYPSETLIAWKQEHEGRMSGLVGRDLETSLLHLGAARRGHDVARDLLQWLDGHRFMMDIYRHEQPSHVRLALDSLRAKLTDLLSSAPGGPTTLTQALTETQRLVIAFFAALQDVHIDQIRVTSGDPEFERFVHALTTLRRGIGRAMRPLAEEENLRFAWLED